jgi:diaminohydroxyphosphoribosylaminopyrimidine deaminase/5-amino-6-(5-phosphoribosylamino)uracil reductase
VITGIDTILADDPQLNVRSLGDIDIATVVQPKRVVLDRQGRLPLNAQILAAPETVMVMGPFRQELARRGTIRSSIFKRFAYDFKRFPNLRCVG